MPRQATISKEMIKKAGIEMILSGENLNARAIAKKLGCSIQPVFYNYATMDDLKADVLNTISQKYEDYMAVNSKSDKYLPYMAIGMAYIGFARDYPQFFKILFMENNGVVTQNSMALKSTISLLTKLFSCSVETAMRLQTEMWVFVHGFATMIATKYIEWDEDSVTEMLSDVYNGLKVRLGLNESSH